MWCLYHTLRNMFKCKSTLRAPRSTYLRIWTVRVVWWRTKAVGVTYRGCVLTKCVFLALLQELYTILLVYVVLFVFVSRLEHNNNIVVVGIVHR